MATILAPNGRPFPALARSSIAQTARDQRMVRARYDAAETTDETARLWSHTDMWSARFANSWWVRKKLRERARYESANNSYCRGIVLTLANDLVGTGPRLQLLTPDVETNARIADQFWEWSNAINLAEKLRMMRQSRAVDGEIFAVMITDPQVRHEIKLNLKMIETDQVTSPFLYLQDPYQLDGITVDGADNPISYTLLPQHPGDWIQYAYWKVIEIPAAVMLHWFRADRPGQMRGVPDITSALPLFAQLRRYTLAVLAAADTAADFAAVLYSELPPDSDEAIQGEPFESLDINRRMMTTLPGGWRMEQFKAEQPTTTYEMFKRELLREIARCLNVPYNIAAGDSSAYNYASGRLDHQTYYKSIAVDQDDLQTKVLDRLFATWCEEARLETDLLDGIPPGAPLPHLWFWDGHQHVDPEKEANAQKTRLENNTTTLSDEYARQRQDWRVKLRQRAVELEYMAELGIPTAPAASVKPPVTERQE